MATRKAGIEGFPRDGRIWRVDWFGSVFLDQLQAFNPAIEVLLSPLCEQETHPNRLGWKDAEEVDPTAQRIVNIRVGELPAVRLGTLWKNGFEVASPRYPTYDASRLEFSEDSLDVVEAGQNEPGREATASLVPRHLRHIGVRHAHSRCLAVSGDGDPYHLLIPAAEVLRFYYGRCTLLLQALLTRPFEENKHRIFDPESSGRTSDGTCAVYPKAAFGPTSMRVAAILACSNCGDRAAKRIHPALVKNLREGPVKRTELEVLPPFRGVSGLRVRGRRFGHNGRKRFLAYEIMAGNLPVPGGKVVRRGVKWKPLTPEMKDLVDSERQKKSQEQAAEAEDQPTVPGSNPTVLFGEEPRQKDSRTKLKASCGKFADEIEIIDDRDEVDRPKALTGGKEANGKKRKTKTAGGDVSTGDGTYTDTPVHPASVEDAANQGSSAASTDKPKPSQSGGSSFREFPKILERLGARYGLPYRLLGNEGGSVDAFLPTLTLPDKVEVPKADGKDRETPRTKTRPIKWARMPESRRREVLVAEIVLEDAYFYAFELEHRHIDADTLDEHYCMAILWAREDYHCLDENELEEILFQCALRKGRWLKDDVLSGLGLGQEKIAHRWQSYEDYPGAIARIIAREAV